MEKDKLLLAVAHNSNNSSRGGWSRVLARVVLTAQESQSEWQVPFALL